MMMAVLLIHQVVVEIPCSRMPMLVTQSARSSIWLFRLYVYLNVMPVVATVAETAIEEI